MTWVFSMGKGFVFAPYLTGVFFRSGRAVWLFAFFRSFYTTIYIYIYKGRGRGRYGCLKSLEKKIEKNNNKLLFFFIYILYSSFKKGIYPTIPHPLNQPALS